MDIHSTASERTGYGLSEFQTIRVPAPELPESAEDDYTFGRLFHSALSAYGIEAEEDLVWAVHNLRTSLFKKTIRLRSSDVYCFAFANRRIYQVDFISPHYLPWVSRVASDFLDEFPEIEITSISIAAGLQSFRQGQITEESLQLLKHDTALWLREYLPESWAAADDQPARQKFLEDAAENGTGKVDIQDSEVVASWQHLVSQRNAVVHDSASEDSFAKFANLTGFELPAELKALLRQSNGSEEAFGFRDLMSIEQITQEWQMWKELFDGTTIDDLTFQYQAADDRTVGIQTTPFWIPFVNEQSGNFIAIDLLPGAAGKRGQIIYFGADQSANVRVLADDLVDFLKREADNNSEDDDIWFAS